MGISDPKRNGGGIEEGGWGRDGGGGGVCGRGRLGEMVCRRKEV